MNDLISRQDAIDAVEFGITYAKAFNVNTGESNELFKEGNDALKKAVERLKELPSAQLEQRWIPCSERLPEEYQDVLVSFDKSISEWTNIGYMFRDQETFEYWFQSDGMSYKKDDILAWMPLPNAYEVDE